ncbi:uncharacterized protein METZ01_LOCUS171075 [marine metagenome]|uniref:Uncharacterized protein n=1 Tax=marine metagenome TaxID=408172 RepID=A0A382BXI7_9ZZZZ
MTLNFAAIEIGTNGSLVIINVTRFLRGYASIHRYDIPT